MGCWNETCGITQMPICAGDKVRMFLIVENEWDSDEVCISYSTELWKPFGLPIKGTYDEYGRIENLEEDACSNLLLDALKEVVIEVPNRMGDVFKREELDWNTAIDFIADEGLRIADSNDVSILTQRLDEILAKTKELVPNLPENGWSVERSDMAKQQKELVKSSSRAVRMYHMMVHEDVYQALTKKYKAPLSRFSSWTEGNLRATLEKDAKEYISQVRQNIVDTSNMSETDRVLLAIQSERYRWDFSNRFVSSTNHLTGSYGSGKFFRKYLDFIEEKIKNGATDDDIEVKNLVDQFIDFLCFNQCMILLRKQWIPQCGKGGQDQEFTLHKFLGETIVAFSDKKIKEWDEECAEYVDESLTEEEEDAEEGEQVSA